MKKRRLSAELNWIKQLHTPYSLGLNNQIYQQGNISSVRSNINVFSLKPDIHRKRRSDGVRRNGLSRRKQRLIRSLGDLLRITTINGRHELLHALSSIPVSQLKPILDEADRRSFRHSDWLKLKWLWSFRLINSFPAYQHFLLKHSLSLLSSLIKAWTFLIFPTFLGIIESPLKSLSISRILILHLFAIGTKIILEISFLTTTK